RGEQAVRVHAPPRSTRAQIERRDARAVAAGAQRGTLRGPRVELVAIRSDPEMGARGATVEGDEGTHHTPLTRTTRKLRTNVLALVRRSTGVEGRAQCTTVHPAGQLLEGTVGSGATCESLAGPPRAQALSRRTRRSGARAR